MELTPQACNRTGGTGGKCTKLAVRLDTFIFVCSVGSTEIFGVDGDNVVVPFACD